MEIFASGGLKDGLDIAKCLALGAKIGGLASVFLKAAVKGTDEVIQLIDLIKRQLKVAMFGVGAINLAELRRIGIQKK
jgi:isopentenyl-diphosphate delta-isomerase